MICGTCWGTSACHWWVSKTSLYAKGFFVLLSFAFVSLLVFDNHGSKQWCSVCSKQAPEVDDEGQRWKLQWKNYCHVFRKHILQQDMYLIGAQKKVVAFSLRETIAFPVGWILFQFRLKMLIGNGCTTAQSNISSAVMWPSEEYVLPGRQACRAVPGLHKQSKLRLHGSAAASAAQQ